MRREMLLLCAIQFHGVSLSKSKLKVGEVNVLGSRLEKLRAAEVEVQHVTMVDILLPEAYIYP